MAIARNNVRRASFVFCEAKNLCRLNHCEGDWTVRGDENLAMVNRGEGLKDIRKRAVKAYRKLSGRDDL